MTNDLRHQEFQDRLLAAVDEVRRHTRLGVATIREDIQRIGGLAAAKARLRTRNHAAPHWFFDQPSEYFLTTKKAGRMDLSIEAIALQPEWQGLFTAEEIDEATATLSEYGFNPSLEATEVPSPAALVPTECQPSLAQIQIGKPPGDNSVALEILIGLSTECEVTARAALALRAGRRPSVDPAVRRHLGQCLECGDLYRDLVSAFERFDEDALLTWVRLLTIFQTSMKLGDERLKRFMTLRPEDFEEPEHYDADLELQLDDSIRPICAWRAVRLGCHIGHFMSAFANTFEERGDLWLKWRSGMIPGSISARLRAMDGKIFILGLLARNLLLVRSWPREEEGVVWVPSDEDLTAVPGLISVDETSDIQEWEEVLGKPPEGLNLLGILYLAQQATVAQVEEFDVVPNESRATHPSNAIYEMLRTIMSRQVEAQDRQEEDRDRQDALINLNQRIVECMSSSDLYTCEAALLEELSGIYKRLKPEARSQLLAAEHIHRTRDFPTPGTIIHCIATAFEIQMRHTLLSPLFGYLKSKSLKRSLTPAEECTFGPALYILRHAEPAIRDYFKLAGLDRLEVISALEEVRSRRNATAHGRPVDKGTAMALRESWFHWRRRPGGIFSVLFRNG